MTDAGVALAGRVADRERSVDLTRRLIAFVLDVVVLGVGLGAALALGVSLVDEGVVDWLVACWLLVVAPLYFALYHAYGGPERGPGWTPGQHELGICLRDMSTGGRLPVSRALARAYGGLAATVLVIPLLADLVSLLARPEARAWRDRLSRSEVARARSTEQTTIAMPTAASTAELFESTGRPGDGVLPRARRLLAAEKRVLFGSTMLLYLGLLGIAALLLPLEVSDWSGGTDDVWLLSMWLAIAVLLFISGVYWAQATVACAVEAIRTGETGITLTEIVRRAARRANALSVSVVLLVAVSALSPYLLFVPLFFVARFALVVPSIVLEDETVLGSFGRSWTLTRSRTFSTIGRLLASVAVLAFALGLVVFAGISIAWAVLPDDVGVSTAGIGAVAGLALAAVPLSALTALVGTCWCLLFYDLRRAAEQAGET